MNRRRLLASLGAATVAGLAGCSSISGGGGVSDTGESCSTPSTDDLSSLLPPESSKYDPIETDQPTAPNADDYVGQVYVADTGRMGFLVAKYGSNSAATEDTSTLFQDRNSLGTVGYVVVDTYVFAVNAWPGGPGKSEIRALMTESSALNQVCVTTNVEYRES